MDTFTRDDEMTDGAFCDIAADLAEGCEGCDDLLCPACDGFGDALMDERAADEAAEREFGYFGEIRWDDEEPDLAPADEVL